MTGGSDGLRIVRPSMAGVLMERESFERALLVLTLVLSMALAWWVQRYFRSGSGQALSAIKTNETRIEYLGFFRVLHHVEGATCYRPWWWVSRAPSWP